MKLQRYPVQDDQSKLIGFKLQFPKFQLQFGPLLCSKFTKFGLVAHPTEPIFPCHFSLHLVFRNQHAYPNKELSHQPCRKIWNQTMAQHPPRFTEHCIHTSIRPLQSLNMPIRKKEFGTLAEQIQRWRCPTRRVGAARTDLEHGFLQETG
jgi:hypothetical protein